MILGIIWLLVGNAASILGAGLLLRPIKTGESHLDFLLFLLLRLSGISFLVLLAGVSGSLSRTGLGAICLVILGFLLAANAHKGLCIPWRNWFQDKFLVVPAVVVILKLLFQVWLFAPFNVDALSYHLPKIAEWIRAGGFVKQMGLDTHSTFPAGFELIETWWVVFLHHDVLIEIAGLELMLLAWAATYSLGIQVGISSRTASFGAFFFALTPAFQAISISCLNDGAIAAEILATFALVLARMPIELLLLPIGLGCGTKATYLYAAPGLLVLRILLRGRQVTRVSPVSVGIPIAMVGIVLGLFWYVRNAIWFGNPIYPLSSKGLLSGTGIVKIQLGASWTNGFRNLVDLLENRITDHLNPYSPLLVKICGWGPLCLACGLPSLGFMLRGHGMFRRLCICMAISFLTVLVLVKHDDWYARFVLFFPAILCLAAAGGVEKWPNMRYVAAVSLLYQVFATIVPADSLLLENMTVLARTRWQRRTVLNAPDGHASDDRIACWVGEPEQNRGEFYPLYGPDFSRSVVYLRSRILDDVAKEMEAAGARLLYVTRTSWVSGMRDRVERDVRFRSVGNGFYALQ